MSFFNELKRRNVFKVAIAYIVMAWLVMQVTDVILNNIEAPDWVFQTVLLLLGIGFLVAMFFAWAFEMTPEGFKREHEVDRSQSITPQTGKKLNNLIVAVMALAIAYFIYDKFVVSAGRETAAIESAVEEATSQALAEQAATPAVTAEPDKSIAVLPFVNMSDDKDYFADGLSEELLNLLTKIPGLKVTGRTSSFKFKGQNEDLRVIGDALDVATVLEGSVRRSGSRIRVTAQLIKVADGFHLWSETYDREMTDVFDMQDDIAAKIMAALKVHLGDGVVSRGRPTENMLAYEKFVMAKALRVSNTESDAGSAIELLQEVVALDPSFAEAWEMLANAHWSYTGTMLSVKENVEATHSAAMKALELDPTLAFAAALAASANAVDYSWTREIAAFETAVQQQPDNTAALFALSFDYLEAGYATEAVPLTKRIVVIEPLSRFSQRRLGFALRATGRVEEARVAWQRSIDLGSPYVGELLFLDYMLAGDVLKATEVLERVAQMAGIDSAGIGERVRAAADPQNGRQAVLDLLETLHKSDPVLDNSWLYFVAFRQFDDFFAIVDGLNAEGTIWSDADNIMFSVNSFRDAGIAADPRYVATMTDMGAVEAWEIRGPPDHCRKDTGAWVCE